MPLKFEARQNHNKKFKTKNLKLKLPLLETQLLMRKLCKYNKTPFMGKKQRR